MNKIVSYFGCCSVLICHFNYYDYYYGCVNFSCPHWFPQFGIMRVGHVSTMMFFFLPIFRLSQSGLVGCRRCRFCYYLLFVSFLFVLTSFCTSLKWLQTRVGAEKKNKSIELTLDGYVDIQIETIFRLILQVWQKPTQILQATFWHFLQCSRFVGNIW